MSCSCVIDIDHNSGPMFLSERIVQARKTHTCCECGCTIQRGDHYEYVSGLWGSSWDGAWNNYKTCLDCVSVRQNLFCSWIYTQMWEDLYNRISCDDDNLPSSECMMGLTKRARDKVCDLYEEIWEEDGEESLYCAGQHCPGYPYKASDRKHPISCFTGDLDADDLDASVENNLITRDLLRFKELKRKGV